MITTLLLGMSYGFAAGISPGPIMALSITQTMQRGLRAGNLIVLAPLVTDAPIILLAMGVTQVLPLVALNIMTLIGGCVVIYLGYETLRSLHHKPDTAPEAAATPNQPLRGLFWRAVTVNALNPHPYLFWSTVGGPLVIQSLTANGVGGAAGFLGGFYALLIGLKMVLVLVVNRSRHWLQGARYRRLLGASGVLLMLLGVQLVWGSIATFMV